MIDALIDRFTRAEQQLAAAGITLRITHPAEFGGAQAVVVDAESERGMAQIIHADVGFLDLMIGDARSGGMVVDSHVERASEADVDHALLTIEQHLGTA